MWWRSGGEVQTGWWRSGGEVQAVGGGGQAVRYRPYVVAVRR